MRRMTEDQIERAIERRMDKLDYRLIVDNSLTQAQYEREIRLLNHWAQNELSNRKDH